MAIGFGQVLGRVQPVAGGVYRVVCIHGVNQQREVVNTLHHRWASALSGSVALAGGRLDEASIGCVLYGDLFRPPGRRLAADDPIIRPVDLDEFERALLWEWWRETSRVDPRVIAPDARTLARTPAAVQAALRALSGSRFFAGLGERALLGSLRQVRRYLHEPEIRRAARQRLAAVIDDDVRVVVAHSLGSVIAYESLCANPDWPVRALVTLGSPLAIRNLIFDRLQPEPTSADDDPRRRQGAWPGGVRTWTNIADAGDVVALVKDLRPHFGDRVENWLVDNGGKAHDVHNYLTAVETGRAVLAGLDR